MTRFDHTFNSLMGTEDQGVVLWVCPNDDCDTAALLHYYAEPRCSLCTEPMERSEDA
jgi:hypothetical protein